MRRQVAYRTKLLVVVLLLAGSSVFEQNYIPAYAQLKRVGTMQTAATLKETESTLKSLASKLPYLNIPEVLYNRFKGYGKAEFSSRYGKIFEQLLSRKHTTSNLCALLESRDPKIRTLSMVALYSKEEAAILPAIARLAHDRAATFPQPVPVAMIVHDESQIPLEKKTVGDVAQAIIGFYMQAAGYYYGVDGCKDQPGFSDYWNLRKNRLFCASWFAVKLRRASTGCSPTDRTRSERIKAVRKQLDALPPMDRHWTLLWLQTESGFDAFATEGDLLASMQAIGPDRLLKMLQSDIPSDDPDLKPRKNNNFPYQSMQLCVLKHAQQVLRTDQSKAVLAIDAWERDYAKHDRVDPLISPWWSIAAAELNENQARGILHKAFDNLDHDFYGYQRAELASALFRQCGLSEKQFLIDYFYSPDAQVINKQYSNFRPHWLQSLASSEASLPLLDALVKDERFNKLNDFQALASLAETFARLTHKQDPLSQLKAQAWHPLGIERACVDLDAARRQYPKETIELLDVLNHMRAVIKKAEQQH